jgi:hypothetical protein
LIYCSDYNCSHLITMSCDDLVRMIRLRLT